MIKNKGISKEKKVTNKLAKLNEKEIAVYYETLLKKMFKAVKNNDYLTLGSLEKTLKQSIIITAASVKNFSLLFSDIKLKVLTEELANYIDVAEMEAFNTATIEPEYYTLEEANELNSLKEYDYFKRRKSYFNEEHIILENEAYVCIIEEDSENINIIDKTFKNGVNEHDVATIGFCECSYNWSDEFEILEAFVTNSIVKEPSEKVKYIKIKKELEKIDLYEQYFKRIELEPERITSFYRPPFESEITYLKENDKFIAVIDKYHLHIFYKETGNTVRIYLGNSNFLYKFCDYCLGLEPKEIDVPETDPTEEDVPTNEKGVLENGQ